MGTIIYYQSTKNGEYGFKAFNNKLDAVVWLSQNYWARQISKQDYDNAIDAQQFRNLRVCLGYIENGSEAKVSISQDDAAKYWTVSVQSNIRVLNQYSDDNLSVALQKAADDNRQEL